MNNNDEFVQNFDIKDPIMHNKRKKLPVIIAIIIAVAAILLLLIYFKTRLSVSEKLIKGYSKLFETSKDSIADELGIDKIKESKKSTSNIDFSIDSCEYIPGIKGIGINSMIAKNEEKKKLESITGFTYCGTSVMSSDIYVKNNTCYLTIPSLFNEVLSVDLSKIEGSRTSSYILQQIPDKVFETFDMSTFEDIWKEKSGKLNPITMADYIKETSPAEWKEIIKGVEVTETKNHNEIKLSMTLDSIKLFLNKSLEILLKDDAFNDNLEELFNNIGIDFSSETIKESMKNFISLAEIFFKNGIDIYTTLNSKNQITNIKCSNIFKLFGIKLNMDINADFTGTKNTKDKYNGSVLFSYNEHSLNFSFGKDYKEKNKDIKSSHTYELIYNDVSLLNIVTNSDYTRFITKNPLRDFLGCSRPANSFNEAFIEYDSSIKISSAIKSIPSMEMAVSGDISDVSEGEYFTLNVDSLELKSNSEDIISLSGSYSISTKASGIRKPDGKSKNLLKMTKEDCKELYSEINSNLEKLLKSFMELTV